MLYPNMMRNLRRLGHDTFRLDGPRVIYIDPWKLPEGCPPADIVLVTHDHYDHCSPDDISKISREGTVVVSSPSARHKLGDKTRYIQPGESIVLGDVTVRAVPAYNTNKYRSPGQLFHPPDLLGNGYIVEVGGETLYHAGDTDVIPEMSRIECTVALLPVSGTYVMTAEEALEAAKMIKAEYYVPMHYADIVGSEGDAEKFRYLCEEQGIRAAVLMTSEDPT